MTEWLIGVVSCAKLGCLTSVFKNFGHDVTHYLTNMYDTFFVTLVQRMTNDHLMLSNLKDGFAKR